MHGSAQKGALGQHLSKVTAVSFWDQLNRNAFFSQKGKSF